MLFFKECRAILKSVLYFAFVAVVVIFYVTQLGNYAGNDILQYTTLEEAVFEPLSDNPLIKPEPGLDNYGYKNAEIPEQIMPNAIVHLLQEHRLNEFTAYPIGFYKNVKLDTEQLSEIKQLLTEITGLDETELYERYVEKSQASAGADLEIRQQLDYSDVIPIEVDYDTFRQKMSYIDDMLGGGSSYAAEKLKSFASVAVTYEEKLAEYDAFLNDDEITGAYARLFCDYMGIVIALFSVFIPVSFLLRDRRAKMNELIFSRKISSAKIVLARYLAIVTMTILPLIILSCIPAAQLIRFGAENGLAVDYLAFLKYIAAWLLPTLLTTTAIGYFFTALTDTPIAILVQFLWSFISIFAGMMSLEGGSYGLEINIRHNALGNLQLMRDNIDALIINRVFYCLISLIFVILSITVYRLKRRGKLDVLGSIQKILRNIKGSNKADIAG